MQFAAMCIELEGIKLSEVNQSMKAKYWVISVSVDYMETRIVNSVEQWYNIGFELQNQFLNSWGRSGRNGDQT